MGFQRVPDTASVTFLYSQNGEIMENTVHAEKSGGYNAGQINNLATAMDLSATNELRPVMVADCSYLRVEIQGLDAENDLSAFSAVSAGVGAIVGPGLPNNATLSIKRTSGLSGRSARGRVFFVGLAAGDLGTNENEVEESVVNAIIAAWDAIRVDITNEGWNPVIVSRVSNKVLRDPAKTFPWNGTTAVDGTVDSQRGRLG